MDWNQIAAYAIPASGAGATLVALAKVVWPDVRDFLRSGTKANAALVDLASKTDQRLANVEAVMPAIQRDLAILLDRQETPRPGAPRRALAKGAQP